MQDLEVRRRKIDTASALTLIVTLLLFAIAVFEKGLTHELLLEAGILLGSAKLVLASFQAKVLNEAIERKLEAVSLQLQKLTEKSNAALK